MNAFASMVSTVTFISLDLSAFLSDFLPSLNAFVTVTLASKQTLKISVAHLTSSVLRVSACLVVDSGALGIMRLSHLRSLSFLHLMLIIVLAINSGGLRSYL